MRIFLGGFCEAAHTLAKFGVKIEEFYPDWLGTYYNETDREAGLKYCDKMKILMDSGAFTFFNQYVLKGKGDAEGYWKTEKYKKYMEGYIAWCSQHGSKFEGYFNLDVIGRPGPTWEHQTYLESCGLKPLPVHHVENGKVWLKKCLDNYPFFAIGGIASNMTLDPRLPPILREELRTYIPWKDVFSGKIRIHALGVTGGDSLKLFPFYSSDSVSWAMTAAFRGISVYLGGEKLSLSFTNRQEEYKKGGEVNRRFKEKKKEDADTRDPEEIASSFDLLDRQQEQSAPRNWVKLKDINSLPKGQWEELMKLLADLKLTEDDVKNRPDARRYINMLFYKNLSNEITQYWKDVEQEGVFDCSSLFSS